MRAQRIRAACAAVLLIVLPAYAADIYPTKPVRMVVGLPAGSSLDVCARAVSGKLAEPLQQNVVVDNRAGAAGNIAAEIVARARPDGYTLLMGAFGALAVNPNLFNQGLELSPSTPEQLGAQLRSDIARWGKVIRETGIKAN